MDGGAGRQAGEGEETRDCEGRREETVAQWRWNRITGWNYMGTFWAEASAGPFKFDRWRASCFGLRARWVEYHFFLRTKDDGKPKGLNRFVKIKVIEVRKKKTYVSWITAKIKTSQFSLLMQFIKELSRDLLKL